MKLERCWTEKRRNIRHYDRITSIYDSQYSEEQKRKYKAALGVILSPKKGYILDMGCGTGLFNREPLMNNNYIIGVDCSKDMVKKAKQRHDDSKISFICADADYLPFLEKTFVKVFAFTLLQNMPMPEETVKEISRIAKKDSQIALTGIRKKYTKETFLKLLGENMNTVKFIDNEEIKDFIAICQPRIEEVTFCRRSTKIFMP